MVVTTIYDGIVKKEFFVSDDFLDMDIYFNIGDKVTIKEVCGKMYITEHNGKKVDYDVIFDEDISEWLK